MKQKVAILFGGPSSEHDVSVSSALNVMQNIDTNLFEILEVFISKEGLCKINNNFLEFPQAIQEIKKTCDIVYPVLHGSFGEDGRLQKVLEEEKIPFVGSGSNSSQTAMNKHVANALFLSHGLSVPKSQIITKENPKVLIDFPIIIKPISEGSSIGLYKCETIDEYFAQKETIFSLYSEMLVQEYVIGREFTCGVLEIDSKTIALPVSEIIVDTNKLFDYKTKYVAGECQEITPAQIDSSTTEKVQDIALQCHSILGCKSLSRTDVILVKNNKIYVLETNTLPGMTKTSFIPAQAQVYGLSMSELITELLKSAK